MRVGPLALIVLSDLYQLSKQGDTVAIGRWVGENTRLTRLRERHIIVGLTRAASDRFNDGTSTWYRLEFPDITDRYETIAGRLVTAALNDDEDMVNALVTEVLTWPHDERALTVFALLGAQPPAP